MKTQPRLLWVDDDGVRRRFQYEESVLRRTWSITWAYTVYSAAEKLATEAFNAIILDQTLPFKDHPPNDIWGGCALLWWLSKGGISEAVPRAQTYAELTTLTPLPGNREAKVCVVSAFDDASVAAQMRTARADLMVRPKPIDLDALRQFLGAVPQGVAT